MIISDSSLLSVVGTCTVGGDSTETGAGSDSDCNVGSCEIADATDDCCGNSIDDPADGAEYTNDDDDDDDDDEDVEWYFGFLNHS